MMENNTHVLETRFVYYISQLKAAKAHKNILDILWTGKFKRRLKKRLDKLEYDYEQGYVTTKAYDIWKNMIKEVL